MPQNDVEKSLTVGIVLTAAFFVIEVIGGLLSGSLALLGDAGHMFRDVFALLISLSAIRIAKRLPTDTRTFGYHRTEIIAAFVNGLMLIGISAWIMWEAYHRFLTPRPIAGTVMLVVALVGLMVNLYVAFQLHGSHDLNVRSALIHVLADTLASAAVVAAALWIHFTGHIVVDPLLSLAISLLILFSAIGVIRESLHILLEFAPRHIDVTRLTQSLEEIDGVDEIHNVHLWSLCSNVHVLDAHILTAETDMGRVESIKQTIKDKLLDYDIRYSTLEFECEACMTRGELRNVIH